MLDRFDGSNHEDEISGIGEILLPIDEISFMVVVFQTGGVSHGSSRQPESDRARVRRPARRCWGPHRALLRTIDEWKELVIPFLRLGLQGDDKCVCVVSQGAPEEEVLAGLEALAIDTRSALNSGQLVVTHGYSEIGELKRLLARSIEEILGRFRFLR